MSQPTVAQILEALQPIVDPDLGKNIVDLGFVKNLQIDGGSVSFEIELTTPACPIKAEFEKAARERVLALPGVERVAAFILACREARLPLKCTAGLHHPVRHRASEPDVMMHGFLNVFGAGLLAHALGADLDTLTACLTETDPDAFAFGDNGFAWRDHFVAASTNHEAMNEFSVHPDYRFGFWDSVGGRYPVWSAVGL